jgi:hypothetical protein
MVTAASDISGEAAANTRSGHGNRLHLARRLPTDGSTCPRKDTSGAPRIPNPRDAVPPRQDPRAPRCVSATSLLQSATRQCHGRVSFSPRPFTSSSQPASTEALVWQVGQPLPEASINERGHTSEQKTRSAVRQRSTRRFGIVTRPYGPLSEERAQASCPSTGCRAS